MKHQILFGLFFVLIACDTKKDAQAIIDESIAIAGGQHINKKDIEFVFRDKEYGAKHNDGLFEYVRLFKDSIGLIRDELDNDGFTREVNGKMTTIPDSMAAKYKNSVNSVIYFALLPYGLNDPAVNKTHVGEIEIDGQAYDKIKITFDQQGGGKDYKDEFIYWINKTSKKVDYLAYSYHTEGGGMRFRKAYNERYVGNIRFVDYINYQPTHEVDLVQIDSAFIDSKLSELSRIELENIKVNTLEK